MGVVQETTGTLVSVSFEGGYPILHLDNGATGTASDLVRVGEATATPSQEQEQPEQSEQAE